ncbi:unnamed protein product, partial [Meganyctiphanes norvegica]
MSRRNLLLLSNSSVYGSGYLEWAADNIKEFLNSKKVKKVLFVPYALRKMDDYTETASKKFSSWGFEVSGIHRESDPVAAVNAAEAIFIGGGNTFQLLKGLYDNKLIEPIRKRIMEDGVPYIGSSAGTNVSTISINTTNDMPIVYPPSFSALALVPFNINPHYIDADAASKHKGDGTSIKILTIQSTSNPRPLLPLKLGSLTSFTTKKIKFQASDVPIRLYLGKLPEEFPVGTDFSFLLK